MAKKVYTVEASNSFTKRFTNAVVFGSTGVVLNKGEHGRFFSRVPKGSSVIFDLQIDTEEYKGSIVFSTSIGNTYSGSSVTVLSTNTELLLNSSIIIAEDKESENKLLVGIILETEKDVTVTYQALASTRGIVEAVSLQEEIENSKVFLVSEGFLLGRPLIKEATTMDAFRQWKPDYKYSANDPAFLGAHLYYANPNLVPEIGESPETNKDKWLELATADIPDVDIEEGVDSPQFFHKKSMLVSNSNAKNLRKQGLDIGFKMPSSNSKVFHFDGDLLDQRQDSSIVISDLSGTTSSFIYKGTVLPDVSSIQAIDTIPFKERPAFLFGNFSATLESSITTNDNCFDFYFRVEEETELKDFCLLTIENAEQGKSLKIILNRTGLSSGGVSVETSAGIFSDFFKNIPPISKSWLRFSIRITSSSVVMFFRGFEETATVSFPLGNLSYTINENKHSLSLDEVLVDNTSSISFEEYKRNLGLPLPWSALEKTENWLVLFINNLNAFKTNIFNTGIFRKTVDEQIEENYTSYRNERFIQYAFNSSNKKSIKIIGGTRILLEIEGESSRIFSVENDTVYDLTDQIQRASEVSSSRTGEKHGRDFYLYLVPKGENVEIVVSTNSTFPNDLDPMYTSKNTRKIGQFHTLCVNAGSSLTGQSSAIRNAVNVNDFFPLKEYSDVEFYNFYNRKVTAVKRGSIYDVVTVEHPLAGFEAGDILPESIFCLSFHPESSAEGMVYDQTTDRAVDIYLQSGTGLMTASAFNVPHTASRQHQNHQDDFFQVRKRLLNAYEFASMARGSNEKTSIAGAKDPSKTGGYNDSAGRRMISFIGIESACGALWQWLEDFSSNAGSGFTTYDGQGDFGQQYGVSYGVLAGGSWSHAASCGSRCRDANSLRSRVGTAFGGRGVSHVVRKL
ncbi:MAG: hypothetical protein ACRCZZ_04310 [Phocaeicola sp.]